MRQIKSSITTRVYKIKLLQCNPYDVSKFWNEYEDFMNEENLKRAAFKKYIPEEKNSKIEL